MELTTLTPVAKAARPSFWLIGQGPSPAFAGGLVSLDEIDLRISAALGLSGYATFERWDEGGDDDLVDAVGVPGNYAIILNDPGTHTDPVVGGTVQNTGVYKWSASPAGWKRIADTQALAAQQVVSEIGEIRDEILTDARFIAVGGDLALGEASKIALVAAAMPAISDVADNMAGIVALSAVSAGITALTPIAEDISILAPVASDIPLLADHAADIPGVATMITPGHPLDVIPGVTSKKEIAFRFFTSDGRLSLLLWDDNRTWFAGFDTDSPAWAQIGAIASVDGHPFDRVIGDDSRGSPLPQGQIVGFHDTAGQALFGAAADGTFYIGKYDTRLGRAVNQACDALQAPLVEASGGQIVAWHGDVAVPLTSEGSNSAPTIVGNQILFKSDRYRGRAAGYRMNFDGSNQRTALRRKRYECFAHYGQSLAGGQQPMLTFNELDRGAAYMLTGGPVFIGAASTATSVITGLKSTSNIETMAPWLASSIIAAQSADMPDLNVLMLGATWSGAPIATLNKGTASYTALMAQITRAVSQAGSEGLILRGIVLSQGENDANSLTYQADLEQLQADLETDIRAITGQAEPVYLFCTQLSSGGNATRRPPLAILAASVANPKIILTGPDYIFPYIDTLHLTSLGNRRKGEYTAKAINRVVYQGRDWRGVTPRSFTLGSNYVDVRFWVPVTPLVLDTYFCTNPGNQGFTYSDAAGRTISDVAVQSPDTIRVTLSGTIGATAVLSYAYANGDSGGTGPTTGIRGCLRDSDGTLSRIDGTTPLYNPAATFSQALN